MLILDQEFQICLEDETSCKIFESNLIVQFKQLRDVSPVVKLNSLFGTGFITFCLQP